VWHEFWHSFFFREWNGTSFNIFTRAVEELALLGRENAQNDICKLKRAIIERETANDVLFLSSRSVLEGLNAFMSYTHEVLDSNTFEGNYKGEEFARLRRLNNGLNEKDKSDGKDVWLRILREFIENAQSDPETSLVFAKLKWLWETTDCQYLPIMICKLALDHPFILKLGNSGDLDWQFDVLRRFKKILETLEDAKLNGVFVRDRIADCIHKYLNVEDHFPITNADEYFDELAKIKGWLSERTGLYFDFYDRNRVYLEHELRRTGSNLCRYVNDIAFNPLENKISKLRINGEKEFLERSYDLLGKAGMKVGLSDLLDSRFLGSGILSDNQIGILLNSNARHRIVDRWCRHWCMSYVKDSLVYSEELMCPVEQRLLVEYSCPKGYSSNINCAFLCRVKKMQKQFTNQEIPDQLETKFCQISSNVC